MTQSKHTLSTLAAWAQVVAQSWADPQYKADLVADPSRFLVAAGIPVVPGVSYVIVEDTPDTHHLVIPPKPESGAAVEELPLTDINSGY